MKLLAVRNIDVEGPGTFKELFEERGVKVVVVDAQAIEGASPEGYDILLILGGPMSVYQTREFPFLLKELELIRAFDKAGKKVLGVCLGAQLIARALGAKVYKGKMGKEIGWAPISTYADFKALYPEKIDVFHWHGDTFDLPPQATLLARSELYNQAFRVGNRIVGIQCHLELTQEELKKWIDAYKGELASEGIEPESLYGTAELWGKLKGYCGVFVDYFLNL